MASLLKNQILKHLSKFTKNLSSDKINLSTFKGEGELSNLELNEDILTQLLELPSWLRITKAVCNRVAVKIQWTKLKSQPICLYLDEVIVETETCQELRPPTSQNQQAFGGKYGFVDRVMDGIFVHVNSVVVKLTSHKFQASLQLSRVKVQSMTPKWQKPSDLRSTRIRDGSRGEILLFKEIEWQTTRIEATAVDMQEDALTPLRLIANQAKIRIVVKKRLSDSVIISSRLTLLLDDLLWVLTITQLKAAILYANSLKELIERSNKQSKAFAAEKLKKQGYIHDPSQPQYRQQQQHRTDRQESSTAKLFNDFDVASTSYHLITSRFDLHLCDDRSPDNEEKRHWKINGGSMQITFYKLSLDLYPFHPAGGERKSWSRYTDNVGSRNPWVQKLFAQFRDEAVHLRQACESESTLSASSSAPSLLAVQQAMASNQHSPRTDKRLNPASSQSASTSPVHAVPPGQKLPPASRSSHNSPSHHQQGQGSTRLLESCFVVKMEDVTVYMVTTPGQKRKAGHQKLLASDKRHFHLPPEMSVLHLEYTDYFFPNGLHYPVPHSNLYVLVNPVRITMDYLTVLWSNVFMMTLSNSLDMDFGDTPPAEHVDMKVELVMPRIILPAEESVDGQPDRPEAVQLQVSKMVMSNCRTDDTLTRSSLQSLLDTYDSAKFLSETEFPCDDICREGQMIPEMLYNHAADKDNAFMHQDVKAILSKKSVDVGQQLSPPNAVTHRLDCDSLKRLAAADVWAVSVEQVWLEFLGIQNCKNRPVPFVEAIPLTLWMSSSEYLKTVKKSKKVNSHGRETEKENGKDQGHGSNHPQPVRIDVKHAENSSTSTIHSHPLQHPPHPSKISSHLPSMPVLGSSPPVCDNNIRGGSGGNTSSNRSSSTYSSHPQGRQDHSPTSNGRLHDSHSHHVSSSSSPHSTSRQNWDSREHRDPSSSSTSFHSSQRDAAPSSHPSHHHNQRYEDSTVQSHAPTPAHQSPSTRRSSDEDRRPSRLSISPDPTGRDSSRRSKQQARVDSPHSDRSRSSISSSQDPVNVHHGHRRGSSNEVYSRSLLDNAPDRDSEYYQQDSRRRRDRRLQREDSRSSSSPPVSYQDTSRARFRRQESRESIGIESRRSGGNVLRRQSSSSSSDRREIEGYRSGDGWRDERSLVEGQGGGEERSNVRRDDRRQSREDVYHTRRGREKDGEGRHREKSSDQSLREIASSNFRKNRQNSSSSSERGSTVQSSSSTARERRLTRSNSRDRRDMTYELEKQEIRRKSRDGDRGEEQSRYEQTEGGDDGRRWNYYQEDVRPGSDQRSDHHSSRRSRDNECDYDNDVGVVKGRGSGRTRESHSSDSRDRNLTRTRESEKDRGSRHGTSPGRSDRGRSGLHHRQSVSESRSSDRSHGSPDLRNRSQISERVDSPRGGERGYSQKRTIGNGEEEDEDEQEDDDIDQSFRNHQQHQQQQQEQYDRNRNGVCQQNDGDIITYDAREDNGWANQNARPTPEGCKSQDDYQSANNSIEKTEPVNKLCVLVSVDGKVRIQITHFQYLFLLRLSESFAVFQAELSTDMSNEESFLSSNYHQQTRPGKNTNHMTQKDNLPSSTPPSAAATETEVFVPLILKELELAVVCPYQMHQRTFSDDLSLISPFLGGVTSGQDAVFGDDGESTCFPCLVDTRQGRRAKDDSTLQRIQQTISFKSNSSGQLENMSHLVPQSTLDSSYGSGKGLSSSLGSSHHPAFSASGNHSSAGNGLVTAAPSVPPIPFQSEWNARKESMDTTNQSINSLGRDSGIGVDRKSNQSSSRQQQGGSGKSGKGGVDMKKTFTSAFSSLTDKIKTKMEGFDDSHSGDDVDSMSIRTDTSDDEFELMSLEDVEEAPAFAHQQPPHEVPSADDIYSELVDLGDSVSMYAESSTTKGKEMMYIVLFKLDNTEVIANIDNVGTAACVQLSKLVSVQLGNIAYDDFYSRFSTAKGYIQEELSKIPVKKSSSAKTSPLPSSLTSTPRCPIKLKYTAPAFDPALNLAPDPGFMAIQVEDYCLQFKMSGLTCLSDFVEDEKIPEVVPMSLTVNNLLLVLEEDRPPANITSPGAIPMNLCIKQISIDRTKDGMFHISGPSEPTTNGEKSAFTFPAPSPLPQQSPATQTVKPHLVNHATSPMTSPDGTLSLLMATQNEAVLLRRQLEEVRRANRLYEHQILQWRDMQDATITGGGGGATTKPAFIGSHKRQSFTSDMLSSSPTSSSGISESRGGGLVGNHVHHSSTSDVDWEEVERENLRLQHRIVKLEDDLLTVSKEKESLLQTLQLLQDELLTSERGKRTKTK